MITVLKWGLQLTFMGSFGESGSISLGLWDGLTGDLSLYFTSTRKQHLHYTVPLCAGPPSTTDSGEVHRTRKDTTLLTCIGNQNRHDLWYAHQEGESASHDFALSWQSVRIFLRVLFKARLWRTQLLNKHVSNCYLNQSKLCRRPEALSITVGDKESAKGNVEPDQLGNHHGCDFWTRIWEIRGLNMWGMHWNIKLWTHLSPSLLTS